MQSSEIPASYRLMSYLGSKNYELLVNLSRQQSIICIVDYHIMDGVNVRDVARTIYRDHHGGECWEVSARGISYITAFSEKEFLAACVRANLEFIEPPRVKSEI